MDQEWNPIVDLPSDTSNLDVIELRALEQVWREQREKLEETGALSLFEERLRREWAIETGILERIYTLDRGVTQLMIEQGINASLIPHSPDANPEVVAAMIQDHADAVEFLFASVKRERPLSTSYIKELHALLTRHQTTCTAVDSQGNTISVSLIRGDYKKQPNNPTRPNGAVHHYCPPEQVASEMDRLVHWHLRHEDRQVQSEVSAAWLHHAFSQIHPFQDGNGRVARTLASLVFIQAGGFPLTVRRDDRDSYLKSLEAADRDDLKTHIVFMASIQRNTFVQALSIAGDARRHTRIGESIAAARDLLERRRTELRTTWQRAKETSGKLEDLTEAQLLELSRGLESELGTHGIRFRVDRERPDGKRKHYFREQIISTARRLGYYANMGEYHAWIRLVLKKEDQAEVLISFHAVGHEYRGLLAVSIGFFRREYVEEKERQVGDVTPVADVFFQINYRESLDEAKRRFELWLEDALVRALEVWRQGL